MSRIRCKSQYRLAAHYIHLLEMSSKDKYQKKKKIVYTKTKAYFLPLKESWFVIYKK